MARWSAADAAPNSIRLINKLPCVVLGVAASAAGYPAEYRVPGGAPWRPPSRSPNLKATLLNYVIEPATDRPAFPYRDRRIALRGESFQKSFAMRPTAIPPHRFSRRQDSSRMSLDARKCTHDDRGLGRCDHNFTAGYSRSGSPSRGTNRRTYRPCPGTRSIKPLASNVTCASRKPCPG
jgi:hypothetical protein